MLARMITVLFICFVIFPGTLFAKEKERNFYFSGTGGAMVTQDMGMDDHTASSLADMPKPIGSWNPFGLWGDTTSMQEASNVEAELEFGAAVLLAVGIKLGHGFRFEVEGGYRQANFKQISFNSKRYFNENTLSPWTENYLSRLSKYNTPEENKVIVMILKSRDSVTINRGKY